MGEDDLEITTPLYFDMYICTEFLKCTHQEFLELPRIERKKLRTFTRIQSAKMKKETDQMKEKTTEVRMLNKAPKVRR